MPNFKTNLSKGLVLSPNSITDTPESSCEVALNVSISREGLVQKRRGYNYCAEILPPSTSSISSLLQVFKNNLYIEEDGGINIYDQTTGYKDSELIPPDSYSFTGTSLQSNSNMYLSHSSGIVKVEDSTKYSEAGIEAPLNLSISFNTGTGYTIVPDSQVSYRVLCGRKDYNGNKVLGEVSSLEIIINPLLKNKTSTESSLSMTINDSAHGLEVGDLVVIKNGVDASGVNLGIDGEYTVATKVTDSFTVNLPKAPTGTMARTDYGLYKDGALVFSLPPQATSTEYFYQVYRSTESSGAEVPPLEDLQLVLEENLDSTQITNKEVSITDIIPSVFRSAYLFTNPNQSGILQNNNPPPPSLFLESFKNTSWFASVKAKASKVVNLITIAGMIDGSTITIGGITFTASLTAEDVSTNTFLVTNSSGSVSFNIQQTAKSLCKIINKSATSISYAQYVSGFFDLAGGISIVAKSYDTLSFSISSSFGANFNPQIPLTGDSFLVEYINQKNRLRYSKISEPEAVPEINFIDIASDEEIMGMKALRDSLIVLSNKKVYKINGEPGNWYLSVLDSSVRCMSSDSIAILNNIVYFLSNQGICGASDQSVFIVSKMIDPLFIQVTSSIDSTATAFSSESEASYIITTNQRSASTGIISRVVYIYNEGAGSWTSSDKVFTKGTILDSDKICLISEGKLYIERKNQNSLDYSKYDQEQVSVLTYESPEIVTLSGLVAVGDILSPALNTANPDSLLEAYKVMKVDNNQITLSPPLSQEFGVDIVLFKLKGIKSIIESSPLATNLDGLKQFQQMQLFSRNERSFNEAFIRFISNDGESTDTNWQSYAYQGQGWGLMKWGVSFWGADSISYNKYSTDISATCRVMIPRVAGFGNYIKVRIEHDEIEPIEIQLISIDYRNVGKISSR